MIISKHGNEKQKAELLHLAYPGNDSSPIKSIWSSHTAVAVSKKSHVTIGVSASTVKLNSFVTFTAFIDFYQLTQNTVSA